MKTVVLEIRDDLAAVLDTDGIVHIVKNLSYQTGQQLDLQEKEFIEDQVLGKRKRKRAGTGKTTIISMENRMRRFLIPAAAAFSCAVIGGGGVAAYALPVSTVTVDVNPSFKYSLNIFSQVLAVSAYNDEDTGLAEEIETLVKGKKISTAMDQTLNTLSDNEYIMDSETPVVITVNSAVAGEDFLEENLSEEVARWNEDREMKGKNGSVDISIQRISRDEVRKADKDRISPGRKMLEDKQLEKGRRNQISENPAAISGGEGPSDSIPLENGKQDFPEGEPGDSRSMGSSGNGDPGIPEGRNEKPGTREVPAENGISGNLNRLSSEGQPAEAGALAAPAENAAGSSVQEAPAENAVNGGSQAGPADHDQAGSMPQGMP